MDSISLGFMSLSLDCDTTPEVAVEPVELSIGTPSSIIRGCNDEVIVTGPLIWIWEPAPGSPELLVTLRPDALPAIPLMSPVSADLDIWSPSTFEAVNPNLSLSSLKPNAVTTTSPSSVISSSRKIEIIDWFPTDTSWEIKPTNEATISLSSSDRFNENDPSMELIVPTSFPFTIIVTPTSGSESFEEYTFPETDFWENELKVITEKEKKKR